MPRGGRRAGAGRKKGQKTRAKFQLTTGKKPTPAERMAMLRRQVVVLAAGDMSLEDIAIALNVRLARLKASCAHELAHAKVIARALELLRLDSQSESGKTAATKLLLRTVRAIEMRAAIPKEDAARQARQADIIELATQRMRGKT